ncbi:type III pantothenate kinase [Agaribacter marinus]|uniref:Type III pantothenate kinase n=1 Tax=Agaribacter marinus TaxID=1431249 RepID=A0AA37T0R6_9ALTE|nr:type III pantothenate kinase [Agaribacter marinus]GLR69415.1 type III pantothenate kinase [Agaribacter marinus]
MVVKLVLGSVNLLIDIGNTSVKYALYSPQTPLHALDVARAPLMELVSKAMIADHIYVCNVKENSTLIDFMQELDAVKHKITIVNTKAEAFGIKNSYSDVTKMGVDRWMCMLACRALESKNFLVFHAGTAITCDAVVGNKHLGGWICAGFMMSRSAVVANADKVNDKQSSLATLRFGNDTGDCVANGALAQLIGLVMSGSKQFSCECKDYTIYIGGGDGRLLYENLPSELLSKSKYFENLVLIGLACVANNAT